MKFLISSYRRLTAALFTTGKPRPLAAVIGGENKRVKATRWLAFVTRSEQWPPLTQSVERETLNLRVVGSSPTLGAQSFSPIFCALTISIALCLIKVATRS